MTGLKYSTSLKTFQASRVNLIHVRRRLSCNRTDSRGNPSVPFLKRYCQIQKKKTIRMWPTRLETIVRAHSTTGRIKHYAFKLRLHDEGFAIMRNVFIQISRSRNPAAIMDMMGARLGKRSCAYCDNSYAKWRPFMENVFQGNHLRSSSTGSHRRGVGSKRGVAQRRMRTIISSALSTTWAEERSGKEG